jgi:hypothetical protein
MLLTSLQLEGTLGTAALPFFFFACQTAAENVSVCVCVCVCVCVGVCG